MLSNIRITIPVEHSNLNEQHVVKVGRDLWGVQVGADSIIIHSHKQYLVPGSHNDDDYMELDRKVNKLIDKVAAHVRNTTYMSYGLSMQWGYEASYGSTRSINTLNLYPSIHQSGTSITFSPEAIAIDRQLFNDLGSVKDSKAKVMMSYWRRAEELSDLSFHSESFLNFFKVLEGLEHLEENGAVALALLDRFAPLKGKGKKRTPMPTIRRHVGKYPNDDALVKHITKATHIFASANFPATISTPLFMFILDLISMRNHYNVAHQLVRDNKYDSFSGIGQHSDEFSHVIPNLSNIKTVAKLMILDYTYPNKYKYNSKEHKWELR